MDITQPVELQNGFFETTLSMYSLQHAFQGPKLFHSLNREIQNGESFSQ